MTAYEAMSMLMRSLDYLQKRSDDIAAQHVVHGAYIRVGKANVRKAELQRSRENA